MTDDILRMAREAGLLPLLDGDCFQRLGVKNFEATKRVLAHFASLVRADEREACAKVCEDYDDDGGTGETWGPRFAAIIRARNHQPPAAIADRLARHGIPMPGDEK